MDIPLQILLVLMRGPFEFVLPPLHGAACLYFGFVTHMRGCEGLASKFSDPITELVVTFCVEASFIAVKVVVDIKCRPTSIAMFRKDRWLYTVSQLEVFPPLLRP